ncbi:MAG: hypothetical protein ABW171_12345 [Steroidobacter sp.]
MDTSTLAGVAFITFDILFNARVVDAQNTCVLETVRVFGTREASYELQDTAAGLALRGLHTDEIFRNGCVAVRF